MKFDVLIISNVMVTLGPFFKYIFVLKYTKIEK